MPEEIQPEQPNKSKRSYEDWKKSLINMLANKQGKNPYEINLPDERVKQFYDQGLMPTVALNNILNN